MATSNISMAASLPHAMRSPLTSNSLHGQTSLNSALTNASEAAAQSERPEDDREGSIAEVPDEDEEEERQLTACLSENGRKPGEEESPSANGGLEEGQFSQSSRVDSMPAGKLADGDETVSTSEYEPFETSELELIEDALRSLHTVEGEIGGSEAMERNGPNSDDLQDSEGIAMLLKKVQALKARKGGAPMKQKRQGSVYNFMEGLPGEDMDIRQVAQAAAQTAFAAAKTAETVVHSLNRNSQAMENLCEALTSSKSGQQPIDEIVKDAEDEEEEEEEAPETKESKILAIEKVQTEIAKSLVRQNRITHWVLAFIVVSSLAWRYGVVKFVKRINNTIQNPFQGFTDMFKGPPKEEEDEKESGNPFLKLPAILSNDKNNDSKEEDHKKCPATQAKDETLFNLGSILGQEPRKEG